MRMQPFPSSLHLRQQQQPAERIQAALTDGDTRRGLRIGEVQYVRSYGTIKLVPCQLPRRKACGCDDTVWCWYGRDTRGRDTRTFPAILIISTTPAVFQNLLSSLLLPPACTLHTPSPPPPQFPSIHLFSTSTCSNSHTPAPSEAPKRGTSPACPSHNNTHLQLLKQSSQAGHINPTAKLPTSAPRQHRERKILPAARARVTYSPPEQIT